MPASSKVEGDKVKSGMLVSGVCNTPLEGFKQGGWERVGGSEGV